MTDKKIVMGLCITRRLKQAIDERRGYIPRSRYISLILEQHVHNEQNENPDCGLENQPSKSTGQPGHCSANSSDPFTDSYNK